MKTAGIVIDAWKLPVFQKHLNAAGFKYMKCTELDKDVLLLEVQCEFAGDLKPIVEMANKECANEQ